MVVDYSLNGGFSFAHTSKEPLGSIEEAEELVKRYLANRNKKQYPTGYASSFSTIIVDITDHSSLLSPTQQGKENHFYLIQLPPLNPLFPSSSSSNETDSKLQEEEDDEIMEEDEDETGSDLKTNLFSFVKMVDSFSRQREITLIQYSQSHLSQFLEELFGGDCVSFSLTLFSQGESSHSFQAAKLSDMLSHINFYPTTSTPQIRGLINKYRSLILGYRQKIDGIKGGGGGGEEDKMKGFGMNMLENEIKKNDQLQNRILGLEKDVYDGKMQEHQLKLDGADVLSKQKEFEEKYKEMMVGLREEKNLRLKSEEEKLMLTRSLLEVQLHEVENQKGFEKVKFDLKMEIQELNEVILDYETKLMEVTKERDELNMQVEKMMSDLKENELIIGEFNEERTKKEAMIEELEESCEELRTHVFQLTSLSNSLTEEKNKSTEMYRQLVKEYEDIKEDLLVKESTLEETKVERDEFEKRIQEYENQRKKMEIDNQTLVLRCDSLKVDFDKKLNEIVRDQDFQVRKVKNQSQEELGILKNELEILQIRARKEMRRRKDAEADFQNSEKEVDHLKHENDKLEGELASTRRKYIERFRKLQSNPEDSIPSTRPDDNRKSYEEEKKEIDNSDVVHDDDNSISDQVNILLIDREERMKLKIESLSGNLLGMMKRDKILVSHCRNLFYLLHDNVPNALDDPSLEEISDLINKPIDQFGEEEKGVTIHDETELTLNEKILYFQSQIKDKDNEISIINHKEFQLGEEVRNLESLLRRERKQFGDEIDNLQFKLSILTDEKEGMIDQISQFATKDTKNDSSVKSIERKRDAEASYLTTKLNQANRKEILLKRKIKELEIETDGMRERLMSADYLKTIELQEENGNLRKKIEELESHLTNTERDETANRNDILYQRVTSLESENVILISKNSRLEHDLQEMESNLKETVLRFKTRIHELTYES